MDVINCILVYDAILLLLLLGYLKKNGWGLNGTSYILLFLFLCSVISTFYFLSANGVIRNYENITISPFLYMILCYVISIYPIYLFDSKKKEIIITVKQYLFVKAFSIFLIVISVEPLLENLYRLNDIIGDSSYAYRMYDDRAEYLSFFGRKLHAISSYFNVLYPVLILFFLYKKEHYSIVVGLLLVTLNYWLHELGLGGRSKMVQSILYSVAVYFLMRKYLALEIDKKIRLYGGIILLLGILFVVIISFSRFDSMASSTNVDSIWIWLGLYAGEGPLNFNSLMWNVTESTNGDNTFIFLRDLLGLSDASSVEDIYRSNLKLGIPENIFYTYIGSIYKDYNLLGTILFLFIFSTLVSFVLKSKQNGFNIVQIIILSIWMKILSVPTFYTYTTWVEQFNLLFVYLFCIYLYVLKFGRKTMFRYR